MWIRTACVAVLGTALRAQNTYYLPELVDGNTATGSVRTTIVIVNFGKAAATVKLAASRDDSSGVSITLGGLGTGTTLAATLAPGATRLFTTDGSGDGTFSAAQIASDSPVSVSAFVTALDASGAVVSESSIPAISADELAAEYLLAVDTTAPMNTAVALYNPSSSDASIGFVLLDTTGQTAATNTITLGAGQHATLSVNGGLFAGLGDFRGSLDVSSPAIRVAVAGLRQYGSTFSIVPAISRLAHPVRFLFPQISDGPSASGGGTVQTTFILTNLSAAAGANASLATTLDDGTPMVVTVNGMDGSPIPPGGTVFWQSDGASPSLATGAAVIQSDQPLAVTAVVRTSDSNGAVIQESAVVPATLNYQFLLPFDQSLGVAGGAVFQNSGRRPVGLTLTLLDPDGGQLATAQAGPLPALGRMAGMIQDFFPGVQTAAAGSILVSTGTPVDMSLAAFNLRQNATAVATFPALRIPVSQTGPPSTVKPILSANSASGDISTGGGTLSIADAKGNKFTLTIPQGALLDRQTIRMTPITSATGITSPGLTAGVLLEPDGMAMLKPAQLRIDLAGPQPVGTYPIGWRGTAPGVYLNPPLQDPQSLTLVLTHFSGAGVGGFDLTSELTGIANQLDLVNSAAAYWAGQARQDALAGDDASSTIDGEKLQETLDIGLDTVLEPMIELAMASDDEDVMRCAVTLALAAVRQLELLGEGDDPHAAAAQDFIQYAFQRWTAKVKTRCDRHDFTAFYDAMGVLRQAALLGLPADIDPTSCLPSLELDYTSEMTGDIPVGVTGNYDASLSGKVTLSGSFTKDMLSQVTDPAKDLLTSFTLSGSAPESYDSIVFNVNNVPAGCSETISAKAPATMTVKAGADPQLSQVQFRFNPHYDPQAVTANGQQLCSFCPVFRKVPLKVGIWMDPGKPSETLLSTCQGVSQSLVMYSWWTAWVTNHASSGDNGYIENWDLVDTPAVFAQKTINTSNSGPGGIKLSEKTDLKLKPVTQ